MASGNREKFDNPVIEWVDSRLPIFTILNKEYGVFPTPRNFNYFWNFGAIAFFMLAVMIATGIILAMHYTANVHMAFDSVERIMRDVNGGWFIRYVHMNGASFFFIAVYIHMFRGIYYGSYKRPRELLWILGVLIFLLMMATAFMGYVLPWGQMSLWGATVITNLFSAVPFVGPSIVTLLWGGFSVDNPTLTRFFALHYLMPFVIFAVVFLHIWALHVTGSNNPLGLEPKSKKDTLPFHPYYTMKDTFGLIVFIMIYAVFIFYMPDALGHPDNYIPANPMVTPPHIVPEWYFLPFYAILRAVTFGINWYLILAGLCAAYAYGGWMVRNEKGEFFFNGKNRLYWILAVVLGVPGAMIAFMSGTENAFLKSMINIFNFDFVISSELQGTKEGTQTRVFIDMLLVPISAKLGGVLAMFGSIAMLFVLPWLDFHPIRSARFRPLFRLCVILFTLTVVVLGYAGSQPADRMYVQKCFGTQDACAAAIHGHEGEGEKPLVLVFDNTMLAQGFTGLYFVFFLIVLPLLSRYEKGRELPPSIHQAVLAKSHKAGA